MKKTGGGVLFAALLLIAAGLALVLYHPVRSWVSQLQSDNEIAGFQRVSGAAGAVAPEGQDGLDGADAQYSDLHADMQAYNEGLYATGQAGLTDPWSYEQQIFDLVGRYGLETEVVGTLSIPAMGIELPVYLGATEENMARGAAVLGQTSMPIGGQNTNCVIAGHRGWYGSPMFRDIEELRVGDGVFVTTYWGELEYRVEGVAVIEPDDVEAILIQPGRDMLTLLTCHPYGVGTQRYVVYCAAVDGADFAAGGGAEGSSTVVGGSGADAASAAAGQETGAFASSALRIQVERLLPFAAIPLVVVAAVLLLWPRNKKRSGKHAA